MVALTQLIAQGALDTYLTGTQGATTFWKVRYNKHANFAMENVKQPFSSTAFGGQSQLTLNRQGDLIYYMYVHVILPGIEACDGGTPKLHFPAPDNPCQPCESNDNAAFAHHIADGYTESSETTKSAMLKAAKDKYNREAHGAAASLDCCEDQEDCPDTLCPELGGTWCHWTNDIGQHLIQRASMVIGGSHVDHLYSDFLFMWEELSGKSGRRLTEMIGKRYTRTQLICDSRSTRHLWIPLPWWFTQHSGQSLALASLRFHGVRLDVHWADLKSCIVVSKPGLDVNFVDAGQLTNSALQAELETTYVYLDNNERERFATSQYEVLITQNQVSTHPVPHRGVVKCALNFNHPILEIIFAVRRTCQDRANNWFNYSGVDNKDPVVHASLSLNNQTRFSAPGAWFRLVQPYQHHSNIPDSYIYVYSFALHPEDPSPSGSCNFSRVDHVELHLKLQDGIEAGSGNNGCTVYVFARNWNVLRFKEGLAGLAFAN